MSYAKQIYNTASWRCWSSSIFVNFWKSDGVSAKFVQRPRWNYYCKWQVWDLAVCLNCLVCVFGCVSECSEDYNVKIVPMSYLLKKTHAESTFSSASQSSHQHPPVVLFLTNNLWKQFSCETRHMQFLFKLAHLTFLVIKMENPPLSHNASVFQTHVSEARWTRQ